MRAGDGSRMFVAPIRRRRSSALSTTAPAEFSSHISEYLIEQLGDWPAGQTAARQILRSVNERGLNRAIRIPLAPSLSIPAVARARKNWPAEKFLQLADRAAIRGTRCESPPRRSGAGAVAACVGRTIQEGSRSFRPGFLAGPVRGDGRSLRIYRQRQRPIPSRGNPGPSDGQPFWSDEQSYQMEATWAARPNYFRQSGRFGRAAVLKSVKG